MDAIDKDLETINNGQKTTIDIFSPDVGTLVFETYKQDNGYISNITIVNDEDDFNQRTYDDSSEDDPDAGDPEKMLY